jgi:hypothetical protein
MSLLVASISFLAYVVLHHSQDGKPFWSLPKRPPLGLKFDPYDPLHQAFVVSAASLRAHEFGIPIPVWNEQSRLDVAVQAAKVILANCIAPLVRCHVQLLSPWHHRSCLILDLDPSIPLCKYRA